MDFVCLANSYKTGGRCVAGIDLATGRWIRPVSGQNSGELNRDSSLVFSSGPTRYIKPFDVVDLGQPIACPNPGQPENVLRGEEQWRLKRIATAHEVLQFAQPDGQIFLGDYGRISVSDANQIRKSLTLIRVQNPSFALRDNETLARQQLRGRFTFSGRHYDLSVTDDSPWTHDARLRPIDGETGDWLLTISLGVPWRQSMYKMIACAMRL